MFHGTLCNTWKDILLRKFGRYFYRYQLWALGRRAHYLYEGRGLGTGVYRAIRRNIDEIDECIQENSDLTVYQRSAAHMDISFINICKMSWMLWEYRGKIMV